MHQDVGHLLGGRWSAPGERRITVENPATETVIGSVPVGGAAEVEEAVSAAGAAAQRWRAIPADERAALLDRAADSLSGRRDELAGLVVAELGAPVSIAGPLHVDLAVQDLRGAADALRATDLHYVVGNSEIDREPVGLVAAITPWNFPLHQVTAKIGPALAAGCPVVLKPSEVAPFGAVAVAEALLAAGLPAGVLNIVHGDADTARTLLAREEFDAVSFTGSDQVGALVAEQAARTFARVTLELGGKSASVVLDDANLARAVRTTLANCFLNSGQACNALTRLVVPQDRLSEVEAMIVEALPKYVPGDPTHDRTRLGPLVSAAQRQRVVARIEKAEGRLLGGGPERPAGLPNGHYVQPTVFADVDPGSDLAQNEVFGPVLAVLTHRGDDDAVAIANDSAFGLGGAVWSEDQDRARAVARGIRTGQVDLNGARFNPAAPFGGFGRSGYGRELGTEGLLEFLTTRSLQV